MGQNHLRDPAPTVRISCSSQIREDRRPEGSRQSHEQGPRIATDTRRRNGPRCRSTRRPSPSPAARRHCPVRSDKQMQHQAEIRQPASPAREPVEKQHRDLRRKRKRRPAAGPSRNSTASPYCAPAQPAKRSAIFGGSTSKSAARLLLMPGILLISDCCSSPTPLTGLALFPGRHAPVCEIAARARMAINSSPSSSRSPAPPDPPRRARIAGSGRSGSDQAPMGSARPSPEPHPPRHDRQHPDAATTSTRVFARRHRSVPAPPVHAPRNSSSCRRSPGRPTTTAHRRGRNALARRTSPRSSVRPTQSQPAISPGRAHRRRHNIPLERHDVRSSPEAPQRPADAPEPIPGASRS